MEKLYLRHCYLYRSDCLFDLGRYHDAIQYYELTALNYQLTPTALNAFVQIVNCQIKLANISAARSANQRAYVQFQKISKLSPSGEMLPFDQDRWKNWFAWIDQSGLW